jgi:Fur family iron response transcriptional regulator
MSEKQTAELLCQHDIQPSAQRVAIARYVLSTDSHPTADRVWEEVRETFPLVSRATVYNTLNLFVRKGLLRHFVVSGVGRVFDPEMGRHHHVMDEDTGDILDIPWDALRVEGLDSLEGFEVTQYTVVARGRRRRLQK